MPGPVAAFAGPDIHANRPSTATGAIFYSCTTHGLIYRSSDGGVTWATYATLGTTTSALTVKDEGSNLDTAVTSIDFVGAGVVATNSTHAVTVTVGGGGSGSSALAMIYVATIAR